MSTSIIICIPWNTFVMCLNIKQRSKRYFVLYSPVSSPLDRSNALHFPPLEDLLIPTPTRLLREVFQLARINYTRILFTHISPAVYMVYIARYSFIQLSRLRHRRENKNAQTSKQKQSEDSNPGSPDCESGILPLSCNVINISQ